MEHYTSTVRQIKKLTHNIVELELTNPIGFTFVPGQYVGFQMEYTARSYSMVSTPEEDVLRFCIKLVEDGVGSEYVGNLKVGDTVEISGPYGRFTYYGSVMPGLEPASRTENLDSGSQAGMTQKDILFIATGVGIAPVRSIIFDILKKKFTKNIMLLFGLHSEEDIFYYDIFQDLDKHHKNFSFIPMLSQPQGVWAGEMGRVTDYLKAHSHIARHQQIFICGSQAMVTDVRDLLLRAGVPLADIKQEIFY